MKIAPLILSAGLAVAALQTLAANAAQSAPAAAATQQPSELVQESAQGILKDLEANREMYRRDNSKVSQLVDKYLLPHFDTQFAAQLVLGVNWRTATEDQRKRFVD